MKIGRRVHGFGVVDKARREVVDQLEEAGVIVTPYRQTQSILEFARQ